MVLHWEATLADLMHVCVTLVSGQGYAQLVFSIEATSIEELTLSKYQQLCELQSLTESSLHYVTSCITGCHCHSLSLVNYIAYLSSKHSCEDVTSHDLNRFLNLVKDCRQYYSLLDHECWSDDADSFQTMNKCNVSRAE